MRPFVLFLFAALSLFMPTTSHASLHTLDTGHAYWRGAQWSLKAAHVPAAWTYTRGAGTTLCDVDTGGPVGSPDLTVSGGFNAVASGQPWTDGNGHGTHTAGIAVGNGTQIQGVAPDAKLIVAKVLGDDGSGSDESVTSGMAWCIAHGATVVNMSLGGDSSGYDGMAALVRYGCKHGVDFSVAAGNAGTSDPQNVPANIHSACLIVSEASEEDGALASFTNVDENPRTIVSPGTDILSDWLNGGVAMASGTSMSAPLTSGALLLLRSEGYSAKDAVRRLLHTANRHVEGYNKMQWGWGEINVGRAVAH